MPRRARFSVRLERQLLRHELVELEARPRRVRALVQRMLREPGKPRRRRVQEVHRVGEFPQVVPRDELVRERFGGERRIRGERARDHLAQRFLREPGRRRVDGRQPIGQRRARLHDLELRMHDLASEVTLAHLAEHAHPPPGRERLLLVRVEVEEAQHQLSPGPALRFRVFEQADELPPRPVLDVRVDDGALGLLLDTGHQCRQRNDACVIFVAQRQVQHQVLVADEAEPDELVFKSARRRAFGGRLLPCGLRGRDQIADGGSGSRRPGFRAGFRGLRHGIGRALAIRTSCAMGEFNSDERTYRVVEMASASGASTRIASISILAPFGNATT